MPSKLAQLVERVHKRTLSGRLQWEATEREDVYQAAFPEYALRISSRPTRPNSNTLDYTLTLYNEDGSIIEQATDPELSDEEDINYDAYQVMKETYDRARGQAMGIEKALDDILGYLDDEEPSTSR